MQKHQSTSSCNDSWSRQTVINSFIPRTYHKPRSLSLSPWSSVSIITGASRCSQVVNFPLGSWDFNFVTWRAVFSCFHCKHFHFLLKTKFLRQGSCAGWQQFLVLCCQQSCPGISEHNTNDQSGLLDYIIPWSILWQKWWSPPLQITTHINTFQTLNWKDYDKITSSSYSRHNLLKLLQECWTKWLWLKIHNLHEPAIKPLSLII